ncbi:MAG: LLM class flavin-dependent oxidoreductase [Candidatus Rokubacteria bacterium]|nr:LLM class flavin-dependent oxidoreductase [Candidatus Rokubacteria bacterium]
MSELPRIALRVPGSVPARACVEQARAAEDAGFTTLWFAENPFGRGALPALTACALATTRIRLGAGVFNPFNRHPTLIAMEMATFDELCGGRAVVGIGSGTRVAQMGLPGERRMAAMRDAMAIVRGLLRGEAVSHAGTLFSARNVRLEFPLRRPGMPILMAAMGDRALRLCGELADGLMISNLSPRAFTRRAVDIVARAAAAAGRSTPRETIQYVPCAVGDDGTEARRRAKVMVGGMLSAFWQSTGTSAATKSALRDYNGVDPEKFEHTVQRLIAGEPAAHVIDDALLHQYAIAGTARECLEQCRAYGEAGVTELAIWFSGPQALPEIARSGEIMRTSSRTRQGGRP